MFLEAACSAIPTDGKARCSEAARLFFNPQPGTGVIIPRKDDTDCNALTILGYWGCCDAAPLLLRAWCSKFGANPSWRFDSPADTGCTAAVTEWLFRRPLSAPALNYIVKLGHNSNEGEIGSCSSHAREERELCLRIFVSYLALSVCLSVVCLSVCLLKCSRCRLTIPYQSRRLLPAVQAVDCTAGESGRHEN